MIESIDCCDGKEGCKLQVQVACDCMGFYTYLCQDCLLSHILAPRSHRFKELSNPIQESTHSKESLCYEDIKSMHAKIECDILDYIQKLKGYKSRLLNFKHEVLHTAESYFRSKEELLDSIIYSSYTKLTQIYKTTKPGKQIIESYQNTGIRGILYNYIESFHLKEDEIKQVISDMVSIQTHSIISKDDKLSRSYILPTIKLNRISDILDTPSCLQPRLPKRSLSACFMDEDISNELGSSIPEPNKPDNRRGPLTPVHLPKNTISNRFEDKSEETGYDSNYNQEFDKDLLYPINLPQRSVSAASFLDTTDDLGYDIEPDIEDPKVSSISATNKIKKSIRHIFEDIKDKTYIQQSSDTFSTEYDPAVSLPIRTKSEISEEVKRDRQLLHSYSSSNLELSSKFKEKNMLHSIFYARRDSKEVIRYNTEFRSISKYQLSFTISNPFKYAATCILPGDTILVASLGSCPNFVGDTYRLYVNRHPIECTRLGDMNYPRQQSRLVYYKDHVYILGGYKAGYSDKAERMKLDEAVWKALPDMKQARVSFGVYTEGDRIYAIGGLNANSIEYYDINQNSFNLVTNILLPSFGTVCGVINDKIYVIGQHLRVFSKDFKLLESQDNIHSRNPNSYSNVVVTKNRLFYIDSANSKLYAFDPKIKSVYEVNSYT
jgi:hypothetical protein